ncbi:hypothetical protein EFK50_19025 [Nocardioides marmoriginsengisoli]|uniref:Uncharacterized protein n=1 Tax=Nocardioides marmoriginsengisoli TaxID=661483 RepID=A0A3N0CAT4_9ACTN|nr:hypothetical protein [Nocardioides marmoriginsengisoli]RNL60429.1 hypothetical protein EFK50_19025 [Nocardioides marmoriginsengisoli]
MQLNPRSATTRAQAALCVLAVTVGLTVAPSLLVSADASSNRSSAVSAACTSAKNALTQAKRQQKAAKASVLKARKAVKKAKHTHRPAKVRKAKKALARSNARYNTWSNAVTKRQSRVGQACAAPTSAARANGIGKQLSLLGLGSGLDLGAIDASQLTSLLNQLLPGVTTNLDAGRLTALLSGFNAGNDLDATDALALLSGVFSPSQILALLEGTASPELLTDLAEHLVGQLSGLAGSFPIPGGFDPTGLFQTFAGMFGGLGPAQLGSLLQLVTGALGSGATTFDLGQLTSLLDSLIPGASDQFDAGQLTSMLGALNGGGLSAGTLSNLLGGQFSITQLQSVISGTAGQALLGTVIAQVMAQVATAGAGGLALPGVLDLTTLTNLVTTVTSLLTSLTGGGGVLPIVCGLIPLPLLCP